MKIFYIYILIFNNILGSYIFVPKIYNNKFVKILSDKADIFVTEYSNQTADNINKFLIIYL